MSNCLTLDQLARLVTEELVEQERSLAAAHVEECYACQRASDDHDRLGDTGTGRFGHSRRRPSCAPVRASQGPATAVVSDRPARRRSCEHERPRIAFGELQKRRPRGIGSRRGSSAIDADDRRIPNHP